MILGTLGVETDHPPKMCAGLGETTRRSAGPADFPPMSTYAPLGAKPVTVPLTCNACARALCKSKEHQSVRPSGGQYCCTATAKAGTAKIQSWCPC